MAGGLEAENTEPFRRGTCPEMGQAGRAVF